MRGLRRNLSLLAAEDSRTRKVSSTLLHWLMMAGGLQIGPQLQELSVITLVLVGLQEQDEKLMEANWQLGTKSMIS